jgi:hydroxymethylglutaryl-CoA reductase
MIGQIQFIGVKNFEKAEKNVSAKKKELIEEANKLDATLLSRGGGMREIETRIIETIRGKMLIVHMLVDVRDAMGSNVINTMSEAITPKLEQLTGGTARLRIVSNLAIHRTAKAKATWKKKELEDSMRTVQLKGEEVVEAILDAYAFAEADPFRTATHNKGIMNGVDALAIATGNDWRGIEAGCHSYASYNHQYKPLTKYYKNEEGDLVGEIEMPAVFAIIGGATKTNPTARIMQKILGVQTSQELSCVAASLGLAQNFAALRALATEGIQRGHMKLHAKNIAVLGGASGDLIDVVAKQMVEEKNIKADRAKQIVEELSKK